MAAKVFKRFVRKREQRKMKERIINRQSAADLLVFSCILENKTNYKEVST